MAEDYRSKRSFDITTERVCVSNISSAKGLDWACVFLLGFDELEPDDLSAGQVRKLVYVALTRARHRLFVPYAKKNWLIDRITTCLQ